MCTHIHISIYLWFLLIYFCLNMSTCFIFTCLIASNLISVMYYSICHGCHLYFFKPALWASGSRMKVNHNIFPQMNMGRRSPWPTKSLHKVWISWVWIDKEKLCHKANSNFDTSHEMKASLDMRTSFKHFLYYKPYLRGNHRSLMDSLHGGQWCGALIVSFM